MIKKINELFEKTMARPFEKGRKLEWFYPLYEAFDAFFFTSREKTKGITHVRDAIDLKRLMIMVVVALTPCILFGMYNVGYQAALVLEKMNPSSYEGWRLVVLTKWLSLPVDHAHILSNLIHGALYFVPIYLVVNIAGAICEVSFSIIRKHEINEGMLVTGVLLPLIVPPTIPLWQVGLAMAFGILFGKEVFGGTGRNFMNPALVARAFLFFAYPAQISGDAVWVAVDGATMATPLAQLAAGGVDSLSISLSSAFWGFIPGSIGETSFVACLIGAVILIVSRIGSWRTMAGVTIGTVGLAALLMAISDKPALQLAPWVHLILGGWAFGTVFMATDPVTSPRTQIGQFIYGLLIGVMVVIIRAVNPAYPEGMMLAILFANVVAPLIDYFVVEFNISKREKIYGKARQC